MLDIFVFSHISISLIGLFIYEPLHVTRKTSGLFLSIYKFSAYFFIYKDLTGSSLNKYV